MSGAGLAIKQEAPVAGKAIAPKAVKKEFSGKENVPIANGRKDTGGRLEKCPLCLEDVVNKAVEGDVSGLYAHAQEAHVDKSSDKRGCKICGARWVGENRQTLANFARKNCKVRIAKQQILQTHFLAN